MFELNQIEILFVGFIIGIIIGIIFIYGKDIIDRFSSKEQNDKYTFGRNVQVISGGIILIIMLMSVYTVIHAIVIDVFTSIIIFGLFYIVYCSYSTMITKNTIYNLNQDIMSCSKDWHNAVNLTDKANIQEEINSLTIIIHELESDNFFLSPFYHFLYL